MCECRRIEKLRRRTRTKLESKTQRSKESKEEEEEAREAEGRLERKTGQSAALIQYEDQHLQQKSSDQKDSQVLLN